MIVISMDEYGSFEGTEKRTFCVGGFVYFCDDNFAKDKELKRLEKWFSKCCEKVGGIYPNDLHNNSSSSNKDIVTKVEAELERTFPDFVKGRGEWSGLCGRYEFFSTVGNTGNGPECFATSGSLIKDENAFNRYQHVANYTLTNLLFRTSGVKNATPVKLELATRVKPSDPSLREEWEKAGHSKILDKDVFSVVDSASYRGMLLTSIPESNRKSDEFELRTQSIKYEGKAFYQGFLYLADTVCSFMRNVIYKNDFKVKESTIGIVDFFENTVGAKCYTRLYDEIDYVNLRAYRSLENGDYYNALKLIAETKSRAFPYRFYKENWFPQIIESIENGEDSIACTKALMLLEDYLFNSREYSNSVAQSILLPIKKQILNHSSERPYLALLYKMYALEMTIQNHNGKFDKALEAYENAIKYNGYCSDEDYVELRNKMSVALIDMQSFEESLENTTKTVDYIETVMEFRKEIDSDAQQSLRYGFTLSQLGQCYAFLGNYEKANKAFTDALEILSKENVNRQRTMSYYLHSLIESGKSEEYKKFAAEYFGTEDPEQQYKLLQSNDDTNFNYGLFVFVKGLYLLDCYDFNKTKVKLFLNWIEKNKKIKDEHPAQFIYKYCAFLALKYGDNRADKFIEASCFEYDHMGELIQQIMENGKEEFARLKRGEEVFKNDKFTYMHR